MFEYIDCGAYDQITLNANRNDLVALRLRQRVMVDVLKRTLATHMIGEPVSMPVATRSAVGAVNAVNAVEAKLPPPVFDDEPGHGRGLAQFRLGLWRTA